MIDENGMPDTDLLARTMNAGGYLAEESSKAARRCLPVLYAKRDAKALDVSTDALIGNTQKVIGSNLPEGLKMQTIAMMQAAFAHQNNVDAAVRIAVESGRIEEDANPDNLDDEWVENYVEHVKKVTDEDVRKTWANLLIEELNEKGSFSKRTMSTLAQMEQSDAELFKVFCSLCCGGRCVQNGVEYYVQPYLTYDEGRCSFCNNAISYNQMTSLDKLGLVQIGSSTTFRSMALFCISGMLYSARYRSDGEYNLQISNVTLTRYGEELSKLCDKGTHPDLLQLIKSDLDKKGFDLIKIA